MTVCLLRFDPLGGQHSGPALVGRDLGNLANLGSLTRSEHRAKTFGRWKARQPEPGTYLWRSPEGWIAITTNQGTLTLGPTDWAQNLWSGAPSEDAVHS